MATYKFNYTDNLFFNDYYISLQKSATVIDTLSFSETIKTNIRYEKMHQTLFVNDKTQYGYKLFNFIHLEFIDLTDKASPTYEERITDQLELTDFSSRPGASETVNDKLDLSDTITYRHSIINKTIIDNIGLLDGIGFDITNPGTSFDSTYPSVGNVDPTITTNFINTCVTVQHLTLSLQSKTNGNTVVLRAPNFGNKDDLTVTRINTRTLGNEAIVFGVLYWNKNIITEYHFDTLTFTEVKNLQKFVIDNLGLMITITDHENNHIDGIITTGDLTYQQDSYCSYSTSFTFQKYINNPLNPNLL